MKYGKIRPRTRPIPGTMNKLEQDYAAHLHTQLLTGEIVSYQYEAVKFRLADRTFYTPDFMVVYADRIEFHETKGFMEEDANVKLKVVAERFPVFQFVLVRRERKVWTLKEIG
jgi:hypothetical protein